MIKVFIIDDSVLVRNSLKKIFTPISDIEVIGSAPNPVDAFVHFKSVGLPDVFILDIEMPKMDGIEFLEMLATQKSVPTIICSTLVSKGSTQAIDAMRMGAVDIVLKPSLNVKGFFDEMHDEFVQKVRAAAMAKVSLISNTKRVSSSSVLSDKEVSSSVKARKNKVKSNKVIAIGSSTGGVQTLEAIFSQLELGHPPIVVVQHMPAGFTKSFAQRLNQALPYSEVQEADGGMTLQSSHIYIAPGDLHTEIHKEGFKYKIVLKNYPKVNSHKPSVNVLFRSMSKNVGVFGIGFLLTGMGEDGATALLEMKNEGAATYAQDERSCVVYGMPKQAVKIGAVKQSLTLQEISDLINKL